ncbi:Zinc knuckle [Trichostrongylus colubriformis]|uniref:Zinc knuckle n=1 Tax=Trichostrongylus colubriformis TaxID=6319 RepID=A0AAN8ERA0_TRICO
MQKLCQNCGEKDHMATKCPKGTCQVCGIIGHHTSTCKKLFSSQESPHGPHQGKTSKKTSTKPSIQAKPTSASVNTVTSNQKMNEDDKSNMVLHVSNTKDIFLLAGQAQVLIPSTKASESVYVMLNTGADRSFISNELAKRLRLQDIDSK